MLSFTEFFPKKGQRAQKGSRLRVIGETERKNLLYLVNNSKETSIEVVSPDGESITALQFNEYMDIVNADLSSDCEILHITKRITYQKGFAFSSIFYHIHSRAKSRELISDKPINAFFVPNGSPPDYFLLHIINKKISHIHITLTKNSIDMEVFRGGINIPNVISYTYHRSTTSLIVLHEMNKQVLLSEFDLTNFKSHAARPQAVTIHPHSELPPELALNPISALHLPYFRCKTNRIFSTRYGSKICVVEQLFENIDNFMEFSISMYPRPFYTTITVPNVRCDLPLCYQQFNSLIFLFVVNHFICIIDIAENPPFISLQLNPFSSGILSDCSAPLPLSHYMIDLSSGDVYHVQCNLESYKLFLPFMDKTRWDLMSLLCARLQNAGATTSIIKLLYEYNDPLIVVYVIQKIFSFMEYQPHQSQEEKRTILRQRSSFAPPPDPLINSFPSKSSLSSASTTSANASSASIPYQFPGSPHNNRLQSKAKIHSKKMISEAIRNRLFEIENEFPSASFVSRRKTFHNLAKQIYFSTPKSIRKKEDAAQKAISRLESQDNASLIFRSSLDSWKEESKPDEFWQFIVYFAFLSETFLTDFPQILVLKNETEQLFSEIGPEIMQRSFRVHHIFRAQSIEQDDTEEVNYWKERIINESESSSSSSDSDDETESSKTSSITRPESSSDTTDKANYSRSLSSTDNI